MKRIAVLTLSVLCLMVLRPAAAEPAASVACVFGLSGEALRTDRRPPQPVKLLDCLPAGAALKAGPGSRLALAFVNGKRWALGGGASVILGKTGPANRIGDVRALPSVPPFLHVLPVRGPGTEIPTPIIRGERITGLYPGHGATALAGTVVLRFHGVDGAERYRVEVQDGQGAVVFSQEGSDTEVKVPDGLLRPGDLYLWSVQTLGRPLGDAHGKADFRVLDRETARHREALRRVSGDPEILTLLACLDRHLGLLAEARDELRSAAAASPQEVSLRDALASVEQEIDSDGKDGEPREKGDAEAPRLRPGSTGNQSA